MDLIENGLDSFRSSISLLNEIDDNFVSENQTTFSFGRKYKFKIKDVILKLHHSIETLFKYIISEENEYLIYRNINNICRKKAKNIFKQTNPKVKKETINFMDSVNRLIVLKKIEISKWEYDCFQFLNKYRNNITHYEISFADKEVEHLIAKLLPALYKIYTRHIPGFKEYCQENELNTGIKEIEGNYYIWQLERLAIYYKKINLAKERIRYLNNNPQEKQEIFEENSKEGVVYIECPICKEDVFIKKGSIILDSEEKIFYGNCKYCETSIEKKDAFFVLDSFEEYDNFCDKMNSFIGKLISNLLQYENVILNLDDEISERNLEVIYELYDDYEEKINKSAINLIKNIIRKKVKINYNKNINGVVEYGSEFIRNETDSINLEFQFKLNELDEETKRDILKIINNFSILTNGKFEALCDTNYEEEHEFLFNYPNPNIDEEIEGTCCILSKLIIKKEWIKEYLDNKS